MGLILIVIAFTILGTKADPEKAEKIKQLRTELSEDLKVGVIRELEKLVSSGQKFPMKQAYAKLKEISMQEVAKHKRKIVKLANLLIDPNNPHAARKITIDLHHSEVRDVYHAIISEGEIAGRAGTSINADLAAVSRSTSAYINSILNGNGHPSSYNEDPSQ